MSNTEYIPTICLIGLPSSGKSTLVNALVGKRILQSGLSRTTTQVTFIGYSNIFDLPDEVTLSHSK